jgi:hypothetical protein
VAGATLAPPSRDEVWLLQQPIERNTAPALAARRCQCSVDGEGVRPCRETALATKFLEMLENRRQGILGAVLRELIEVGCREAWGITAPGECVARGAQQVDAQVGQGRSL